MCFFTQQVEYGEVTGYILSKCQRADDTLEMISANLWLDKLPESAAVKLLQKGTLRNNAFRNTYYITHERDYTSYRRWKKWGYHTPKV